MKWTFVVTSLISPHAPAMLFASAVPVDVRNASNLASEVITDKRHGLYLQGTRVICWSRKCWPYFPLDASKLPINIYGTKRPQTSLTFVSVHFNHNKVHNTKRADTRAFTSWPLGVAAFKLFMFDQPSVSRNKGLTTLRRLDVHAPRPPTARVTETLECGFLLYQLSLKTVIYTV